MNDLASIVREKAQSIEYKADNYALIWFARYLDNQKKPIFIQSFGNFEFLQFQAWLAEYKPYKSVYTMSIAIRRHCKTIHINDNQLKKFSDHPKLWVVPNKPTPSHFAVLSEEQRTTLKKFLIEKITDIYEREDTVEKAIANGNLINSIGHDFLSNPTHKRRKGSGFYKWQESLNDVIHTLYHKYSDFPTNIEIKDTQQGQLYGSVKNVDYTEMTNSFITIYKRMGIQNLKTSQPFLTDHPELFFFDVLNYLYPSMEEAFIIRWAIEIETGWSPDIVKNINVNDFELKLLPSNEKIVFIFSLKDKGQQSESENLKKSKQIIWPSNRQDKFSAYNLIKLWIKRTSRLRKGRYYENICEQVNGDPFLIYFIDYGFMEQSNSTILAMHPEMDRVEQGFTRQNFQKKHLGFTFDERQLKPTSLYLRETNQNLPLILQVALLGHSDSAVTDEHYKNDAQFQSIRKEDLAKELNEIEKSISDGSFKAKLVPLRQKKTLKEQIITVFYDHAGESPLGVCRDATSPDWPGSELIKTPCRMFNKCLICSQGTVFQENIPFVVDRFLYLKQIKSKMRTDNFNVLYGDEFSAAKEVINNWPYKEQIQEAMDRTFLDGYLLPPIFWEKT